MKSFAAGIIIAVLALSVCGSAQAPPPASKTTQPPAKPGAPVATPAASPKAELASEPASLVTADLFSGLAFRNIGPAIMSGRISDIVIHPKRAATWYVAVGSGGVWKTENAGTTWTPVFDAQPSYSIGCITLDPSNPETV